MRLPKHYMSFDDYINTILTQVTQMPWCAERIIIELNALISAKSQKLATLTWVNKQPIELTPALIDSYLTELNKALEQEAIAHYEINELLKDCQAKIKQQNWQESSAIICKIQSLLIVFDVDETSELVSHADKAAQQIQGQDIVLLLGITGVGKSTTVQYLAGAEMGRQAIVVGKRTNGDDITKPHICATHFENEALKTVKSSCHSQSETRYISAVPIQKDALKRGVPKKNIFLCDTAGFEDSRGAELDVANGIGFVRAVKQCKSVRPVILLDADSINAQRCKGLRDVIRTLSGLMPRFRAYEEAFIFGFTKYTAENAENILATLMDLENSLTEEEKYDKVFVEFLNLMISKIDDDAHIVIDPLDKNPHKIFKKIMQAATIKKPSEVFQFSVADTSHQKIKEQSHKYQLSIINELKRNKYDLIAYRLKQMKALEAMLEQHYIQDLIKASENNISQHLNKQHGAATQFLNDFFSDECAINQDTVMQFKQICEQLNSAYHYLNSQLSTVENYNLHLEQQFQMKLENLCQKVYETVNFYEPYLAFRLNKLSSLSQVFPQLVQEHYQQIQENMEIFYRNLIVEAKEAFINHNFEAMQSLCEQIVKGKRLLAPYISEEALNSAYDDMKSYYSKHMGLQGAKIESLFQYASFTEQDYQEISNFLTMLRQIKTMEGLREFINIEEITNIEKSINDTLINIMHALQAHVTEYLENKSDLNKVEQALTQAKALCDIDGIPRNIIELYKKIELQLLNYTQNINQQVEEQLLKIIDEQVQKFDSVQSMNRIVANTNPSALAKAQEIFSKHLNKLACQIEIIDLQMNAKDAMQEIENVIQKINEIRLLARSINIHESICDDLVAKIQLLINNNLQIIQKFFSLDGLGASDLEDEIKQLKAYQSEYSNYHPSLVYIRSQGHENFEKLTEQFMLLVNYKQDQENLYTEVEQAFLNKQQRYEELTKNYMSQQQQLNQEAASASDSEAFSGISSASIARQSTAILKKAGFSNFFELNIAKDKNKDDWSKQREAINNEIQTVTVSIASLKSIETQYRALTTSTEVSPQATAFLQDKGYQSITEIEQECVKKEALLHEQQIQGIIYRFSKLDFKRTVNAMDFLKWAKSLDLQIQFKKEIHETQQVASTYIQQYASFVFKRIMYYLAKLKQYVDQANIDNKLFSIIQILLNHLQEMQLASAQPILDNYFEHQKIHETTSALLDTIALNLDITMRSRNNKHIIEGSHLNQLAILARALSALDGYSQFTSAGKNFSSLYASFQIIIFDKLEICETNAINCIDKHAYHEASLIMQALEKTNDQNSNAALQRIKQYLSNHSRIIIEELRLKVILLSDEVQQAWLESMHTIHSDLQHVANALKHISQYDLNDYAALQSFVHEQLSLRMITAMDQITAAIENYDFSEASENIYIVVQAKRILDAHLSKEAIQHINAFNSTLEVTFSQIENRYKNMSLKEYRYYPPQKIYKRFKLVMRNNMRYKQAWERIESVIKDRLKNALEIIHQSRRNLSRCVDFINVFESTIGTLPKHLQLEFHDGIEKFKKEMHQEKINIKNTFNEALSENNAEKMDVIFKEVIAREGKNGEFIKQAEKDLLQQIQIICQQVNHYFQQQQVEQALEKLIQLDGYRKVQINSSNIPELIESTFKEVRIQYNDASELLKHFPENSTEKKLMSSYNMLFAFSSYHEQYKDLHDNSFISNIIAKNPQVEFSNVKEIINNYFEILSSQYHTALSERRMPDILQYMDIMSRLQKFCKDYIFTGLNTKNITYEDMLLNLRNMIESLIQGLQQLDFINEKTAGFEKSRNAFYSQVVSQLNIVKQLGLFHQYLSPEYHDVKLLENNIMHSFDEKITIILDQMQNILKKQFSTENDYKFFHQCYENLQTFKSYFPSSTTVSKIETRLQKIDAIINESLDYIQNELLDEVDMQGLVNRLVELKQKESMFPYLAEVISNKIDVSLSKFREKQGTNAQQSISRLAALLREEESGIGAEIVAEHHVLKSAALSKVNEVRRLTHNIDYVIDKMKKNKNHKDISATKLTDYYNIFNREYERLKKKHLKPNLSEGISAVSSSIFYIVGTIRPRHTADKIVWTQVMVDKIPKLMAHIFMLWTLKNATDYFDITRDSDMEESQKNNYLYIPHPAQVVSIFRILGIGYSKGLKSKFGFNAEELLFNNMVQINTGEGKSITLAVAAAILALYGVEVHCACYSQYLSSRDYSDVKPIFDDLGIAERIYYGTFDNLFEGMINRNGNIRDIVKTLISEGKYPITSQHTEVRPKVLLVDEADIFFNKDFYGNIYPISAQLQHETILALTNYIWENKQTINVFDDVKSTQVYQDCCLQYGEWRFLINEAVKDMIAAVKTYQSHSYIVKDDKIAYKEQDTTSSDIVYGYNTLFAYYHEHEAGHISKESLQEHVSIYIDCGSFSYAKFPERFVHIMGVTGTLEHLSTAERKVMSEKYGIKHHTYMPSVYGENKRKFAKNGDIKIENEANYFVTLSEEINNRMQGRTHGTNRAVIIFFDDKEKLLAFKNSTEAKSILHPINELTEEAEDLEKKRIIKEASRSGKVTLLTRAFGRGTDFISYSPQVEANGGVHVIQAFLSEEKTEEIQIQGRTARQGQEGSYSMVLLDTDLEKFLIFEQDIKTMQSNGVFYDCLDEKRNQYFETQYASNSKHIHAMAKEHESSWSFVEALYKKDSTLIKNILMAKNKGANLQVQSSRTLCLMDATGSMAHLLQKAKNTVGTMFERATKILKDHGYPDGSFKLQFAVYRNYNVPADTILEYSSWESNSTNLYEFMTHITTKGGLGNEAIEIGLWHANREANTQESISQVILIGDAPPNTEEEVTNRRATYCGGESYWKATQFSEPTTTAKQLENLQQKKIPVHTFFVARRASQSFEEIATSTQDRYGNTAHCEFLDVNSTNGSEMLTEKITKGILRTTATTEEQANQFEKEYDKRFMKRHL